jgi:glutathione S-transferase
MKLHLISHHLCPYVQRAVIALSEKGVAFERTNIDLANKPDSFLAVSPLGKTPVLLADDLPIFESTVILEYLEETQPNPLHPDDPLERARHRAWMEFGSATLNDIAGFYTATDDQAFAAKTAALRAKFERMESEMSTGPYFACDQLSLVDAAFGPVFRYFDTFDHISDFGILTALSKVGDWRLALADRRSITEAVPLDYPKLLEQFIKNRNSKLSRLLEKRSLERK